MSEKEEVATVATVSDVDLRFSVNIHLAHADPTALMPQLHGAAGATTMTDDPNRVNWRGSLLQLDKKKQRTIFRHAVSNKTTGARICHVHMSWCFSYTMTTHVVNNS